MATTMAMREMKAHLVATAAHMVLPMTDRLAEGELAQVAGGGWGQESMDQLEDDMNNL